MHKSMNPIKENEGESSYDYKDKLNQISSETQKYKKEDSESNKNEKSKKSKKIDKKKYITFTIYDTLSIKEKSEIFTAFTSYENPQNIYSHIFVTTNIFDTKARTFIDKNNQKCKEYIKEEDLPVLFDFLNLESKFFKYENTKRFIQQKIQKCMTRTYEILLKMKKEYLSNENYKKTIRKKIKQLSSENQIEDEFGDDFEGEEIESIKDFESAAAVSRKIVGKPPIFYRGTEVIDISNKIHGFPLPQFGDYKEYALKNLENATTEDLINLGKPYFPYQVPFYLPKEENEENAYSEHSEVNLIDYSLETNNIYEMNNEKFQKQKKQKKEINDNLINLENSEEDLNNLQNSDERNYDQPFISEDDISDIEEIEKIEKIEDYDIQEIKKIREIREKQKVINKEVQNQEKFNAKMFINNNFLDNNFFDNKNVNTQNFMVDKKVQEFEKFVNNRTSLLKRYNDFVEDFKTQSNESRVYEMKEKFQTFEIKQHLKEFSVENFKKSVSNSEFIEIMNKLTDPNYSHPKELGQLEHNFQEWPENLRKVLIILHEDVLHKHKELNLIMKTWLQALDHFIYKWIPKSSEEKSIKIDEKKIDKKNKHFGLISGGPLEISFIFKLIHDLRELKFTEEEADIRKSINWLYEFFFKFFNVYSSISNVYQLHMKKNLDKEWKTRRMLNKKK